jgi:hypothetical protein
MMRMQVLTGAILSNYFYNDMRISTVSTDLISLQSTIQGGNFNWNKIHNLEIGIFVKNPETGR